MSDVSGGFSFNDWWNCQGDWVEPPNVRRGGESGVQRVAGEDGVLCYAKRQVGHLHRTLQHPFGRPTIVREAHALRAWARLGVRVPQVLYSGAQRAESGLWQALLITAPLEGFIDIDSWLAQGGRERHGESLYATLLQQLGATLARLHRSRWQHGCLYPKHVFIRVLGQGDDAQVDVALLDLEKSRRRLSQKRAAAHDFKQLRRHSSWSEADWDQLRYGYRSALHQ